MKNLKYQRNELNLPTILQSDQMNARIEMHHIQHQTFKIHSRATTVIQQPLIQPSNYLSILSRGANYYSTPPFFLHPSPRNTNTN